MSSLAAQESLGGHFVVLEISDKIRQKAEQLFWIICFRGGGLEVNFLKMLFRFLVVFGVVQTVERTRCPISSVTSRGLIFTPPGWNS